MPYNRDSLTWVDTGAIAYPEMHKRILELTMPALIVKRLFIDDPIATGRTRVYVKQAGVRSVGLTMSAEGAPAQQDYTDVAYATVTPYKRFQEIEVPKELIDDVSMPVLDMQLRKLTQRFGLQIEADCLNVLDAAVPVANSFAATGKTMAVTGSEMTIANTIGMKDLNKANRLMKQKNFIMTDILCDPIMEEHLRNLPAYSCVKDPINDWSDEPVQKIGKWTLSVSSLMPAGAAYCVSRGIAVNGEYAPMGFFAVKQPIVSDMDIQKRRQVVYPMMSARYAPIVTNGECLVKLTGLLTS